MTSDILKYEKRLKLLFFSTFLPEIGYFLANCLQTMSNTARMTFEAVQMRSYSMKSAKKAR